MEKRVARHAVQREREGSVTEEGCDERAMDTGGAESCLDAGERHRLHQLYRQPRLQRRVAAPCGPAKEEERVVERIERREGTKEEGGACRGGAVV